MFARIRSLHISGLECTPVDIEVHIASGLPACIIVGLPDAAVSEARDRVRSAIVNSGFSFPRQRVTVNLAPAHTRKIGSMYDAPIAIGILLASGCVKGAGVEERVNNTFVVGELALDGSVRGVRGVLPMAHFAHMQDMGFYFPTENVPEVSVLEEAIKREDFWKASSLKELLERLQDPPEHRREHVEGSVCSAGRFQQPQMEKAADFADIIGQHTAKRALEIAAAGGHNVLLVGPPGAGKTMLAQAVPSVLPPLTSAEIVEATMIHSLVRSGQPPILQRPFRSPHHSASSAAMIGGGSLLQPGEISLAHHGVLLLDEVAEFRRDVLEALRQPLEEGSITITRASGSVRYPAQCMIIATQNPCPCGFAGTDRCNCTVFAVERYAKKLSGPLRDRLDMKLHVAAVDPSTKEQGRRESSAAIRERVVRARHRQQERHGVCNAWLSNTLVQHLAIDESSESILKHALRSQQISMRGYVKTKKVARTIADLAESATVSSQHISEALAFTIGCS